jgi:cholesterol transport system auxiliary component
MKNASAVAMTYACALALAGCAGLFKSSAPPTQVYTLRAVAAAPASPAAQATAAAPPATAVAAGHLPTLAVSRPEAFAGLGSDEIALLQPGGRLDYYSASRWAGNVPTMMQSLAIEALRNSGRFGAVIADGAPFGADYVLQIDIRHFEAEYGGGGGPPTVHVALICTFGRPADRGPVSTFTTDAQVPAAANRLQAVVAAFDAATTTALAGLAADLSAPL